VVEPPTGEPPLWTDERDRKGRPVEPTVKEAAGRIWRRVLYYVRRERNDHAEAAEVLEEAVFSVSARLQSEDELAPIQNLDSYLFHSFVHRFSKRAQREDRIQYLESAEALDSLGAPRPSCDPAPGPSSSRASRRAEARRAPRESALGDAFGRGNLGRWRIRRLRRAESDLRLTCEAG